MRQYTEIPDLNEKRDQINQNILLATRASWIINWTLFCLKFYVVIYSRSKSIIAALVDSAGISNSSSLIPFDSL